MKRTIFLFIIFNVLISKSFAGVCPLVSDVEIRGTSIFQVTCESNGKTYYGLAKISCGNATNTNQAHYWVFVEKKPESDVLANIQRSQAERIIDVAQTHQRMKKPFGIDYIYCPSSGGTMQVVKEISIY